VPQSLGLRARHRDRVWRVHARPHNVPRRDAQCEDEVRTSTTTTDRHDPRYAPCHTFDHTRARSHPSRHCGSTMLLSVTADACRCIARSSSINCATHARTHTKCLRARDLTHHGTPACQPTPKTAKIRRSACPAATRAWRSRPPRRQSRHSMRTQIRHHCTITREQTITRTHAYSVALPARSLARRASSSRRCLRFSRRSSLSGLLTSNTNEALCDE
jgi:hypothetical protein